MRKIKVGYLPMFVALYDNNNPHYRDPMVKYMKTLVSMLEGAGLEVVMADEVCRLKDEFARAAKKFNDEAVDAVITQHLAYSPSLESVEALLSLEAPIVVLDTTPDYQVIKMAGYQSAISANHGIHGVQDMCSMLKRCGRAYYLCVGHAMHSKVISETVGMCRAAAAAKTFREVRVGSVGGAFTGMGDFRISDERYRSNIGAQVEYMTPQVVSKYLPLVTEEEIDAEIASDRSKYAVEVSFCKEYREATRAGLAVRKWMDAEKLNACTVNFLTLDQCGLPKMPFVECCKIMERGLGYAGEGDVLTAGLVAALSSVYPEVTFTEMFCPDWEQDVILLSHMGESNPNLAQWRPRITDLKFTWNSCGNTVAMYNCYRPGKVVYVNLAPREDTFALILTEGELLDVGLERGAYRNATQGWFKPCKEIRTFLKEFSMAGGTHHSAMIYNADIEELKAFGHMMGFDVMVI